MDMYKLITESEDISLPIVMQKTFGALMFTLCFDAKMKGVLRSRFSCSQLRQHFVLPM